MRKWLVGLMVLAASIVGMVAGVPNAHAASSHYTITTDTTFPPFEFQTQGGDYRGIGRNCVV